MSTQMSMFPEERKMIKDSECTIHTPVIYGVKDKQIYGAGVRIKPRLDGKCSTPYEKKYYLPSLLPLEEYDKVVVLFSGGKDSTACYFKLIEMGVPKEKIQLWHHDIDGGHPTRKMDWPVTQNYVKAFAEATETQLRLSWRENGFWGEVYRVGSSHPIKYTDGNNEVKTCKLSKFQIRSEELRRTSPDSEELKQYGYRMKFPAKSGDLSVRWCSSYLKIIVGDTVIRNLKEFNELTIEGSKILIISGERRGESVGRSKYNEMEIHKTNAVAKAKRLVHWWRPVIDYSEKDIWEVIKRNKCNCHPCYKIGWNRCSCMMCIFSMGKHWKGIQELFPNEFEKVCEDEEKLGFTLDNKKNLREYIAGSKSCLDISDTEAIRQVLTGEFKTDEIWIKDTWTYPIGAFKGSEGGPC